MKKQRERLRIGTRGSRLALAQTEEVLKALLKTNPNLEFEIIKIYTRPDIRRQDLLNSFPTGMFVKELEQALLDGVADIAIHSLKDLPTNITPQLSLAAISERDDPRDVLVSHSKLPFTQLQPGAVLGTSSSRRAGQLKSIRSDINIIPIRGNVDTRLQKVQNGEFDAVVLAAAGIRRLGLTDQITQYFSTHELIPPAGQGALAIQIRTDDEWIQNVVKDVNHHATQISVVAERAFLAHLGGGCKVPIGAYGEIKSGILRLRGMIIEEEGKRWFSAEVSGTPKDPTSLGIELSKRLLEMGAHQII